VGAAGSVTVPVLPGAVPTVTRKAAVLLQGEQVGADPNPLAIVGFVLLIIRLPASSLNELAEF
jgi:hypothetical protein